MHDLIVETAMELLCHVYDRQLHNQFSRNPGINELTEAGLAAKQNWLWGKVNVSVLEQCRLALASAHSEFEGHNRESRKALNLEMYRCISNMDPIDHNDYAHSYGTDFPRSDDYMRMLNECEAQSWCLVQLKLASAAIEFDPSMIGKAISTLKRSYLDVFKGPHNLNRQQSDELDHFRKRNASTLDQRFTELLGARCEWARIPDG